MNKTFRSIKAKITQYVHLRYEELRLEVVERIVSVLGYFAFILIAIFLGFIGFIFLGIGLAEWLSIVFEHRAYGYFATAGIFILVVILLSLFKKAIALSFAGKLAAILLSKKKRKKKARDDEDDDED